MNPPLNIEDPIRTNILALKRPLPHEAKYMIEAELDDLVHLIQQLNLDARIGGLKQAKSRVLRRTEIPADAKKPTRDIFVITGEECARIIQQDIVQLESLKQEGVKK